MSSKSMKMRRCNFENPQTREYIKQIGQIWNYQFR